MNRLHSERKNSDESTSAVANHVSSRKAISMPAAPIWQARSGPPQPMPVTGNVAQLKRELKAITGLTHLVEMTPDGSIYNENYEENEYAEVSGAAGDIVQIETDDTWLSRRGPNQEIHSQADKTGPRDFQWFRVMMLGNTDLSSRRIYVRKGMFTSYTTIDLPRDRRGVDLTIATVIEEINKVTKGKDYSDLRIIHKIASDLKQNVKNELFSGSADHVINLDHVASAIDGFPIQVEQLFIMEDEKIRSYPPGKKPDRISEIQRDNLVAALKRLQQVFAVYNQPKEKMGVKGLIGRSDLQRLGVIGLDLGGIGLSNGYLDVNVEDATNSPNPIVIGDAMNLQASFQPACVGNVIAVCLPLVLMVGGADTKDARIMAIRKVLVSVNYVTGNGGKASIQFNDNSGPAKVEGVELLAIAHSLGFTLVNDVPHPSHLYRKFTFTR